MEVTETRQVGKHLFIFEKGKNNASNGRTFIACASNDQEKLPCEFVNYMRKLFDILDEGKRGFVKLSDIEARWGSRNAQLGSQPSGVLESLRRVAPSNGLLSFERLCLGFQLALRPAEGEIEMPKPSVTAEPLKDNGRGGSEKNKSHVQRNQGDSKSLRDGQASRTSYQRPRSMVQLRQQKQLLDLSLAKRRGGILEGIQNTDKETVVEKLRQWQKEETRKAESGVAKEVTKAESSCFSKTKSSHCSIAETNGRRQAVAQQRKGNEADTGHRPSEQHFTSKEHVQLPKVKVYYQGGTTNASGLNGGSRNIAIHNENRIVVSKEAKLKELEQELKVLDDGLRTVEEVRDWFFTRITALQEEKLYVKSVDQYSSQDYEAMVHTNRRKELALNHSTFETFASHVEELKSHLDQVTKNPLTSPSSESFESASKRKIAQLEKDKRALIRELFHYKFQPDKTNVVGGL